MSRSERAAFRRKHVGFVFQNFQLMPMLTVRENIVLPCRLDGSEIPEEYFDVIINQLGLKEKQDNYPWQLSGGQQQRTAIGRALIMRPSIVLADEPTGNLDRRNSNEVLRLLKEANEKFGQTLLIITHDLEVKKYATKCYSMEDGRIK